MEKLNLKHTPGKWTAVGPKIQEGLGNQTYYSIQSDCGIVRDKQYIIPGFFYPMSPQPEEETKANLKLIENTPDMLKALIEADNVLKMASLIDKSNTCKRTQLMCERLIKKITK